MFDKKRKEAVDKRLNELNQKLKELNSIDTKNPVTLLKIKKESRSIQKEIEKLKQQKILPYVYGGLLAFICVMFIFLGITAVGEKAQNSSNQELSSDEETVVTDRSITATDDNLVKNKTDEEEIAEQEKLAQEKAEQEKAEQEKLAKEKAEQEKVEQGKLAQEKAEQEKAEQEKLAKEKAEKEKAEQEKLAQEKAEQERLAQEKAEQDRQAQEAALAVQQESASANVNRSSSSSSDGTSVDVPDGNIAGENLVWVPVNGGKKYHTSSSCSNMEDPVQIPLTDAEQRGYTPCKRCH